MKVISSEKKPIFNWATDLEEKALEQAKNLANLPFTFRHVALMPDCHMGYGMPIGGVLATDNVVIPNAVGVDIGCGMCAIKTSLKYIDTSMLKDLMSMIREKIPVGFKHHNEPAPVALMPSFIDFRKKSKGLFGGDVPIVDQQYERARYQIGTLGGGNHFIEIQQDENDFIWIMIHSGSRNLGFQVAKYYNDIAKDLNASWCSSVPKSWDLAFLPLVSNMAQRYLSEMDYCVNFAFNNRETMAKHVCSCLKKLIPEVVFNDAVNIHHNFASYERHAGKMVMVHRKGATQANKGQIGIIPGSQGTNSYIVEGLGNYKSFNSCSHGGGRAMGRRAAVRDLDFETEVKKMNDLGIIHSIRNEKDLDEAPSAYKDIHEVMANQTDLVKVITTLRPLAVIKG